MTRFQCIGTKQQRLGSSIWILVMAMFLHGAEILCQASGSLLFSSAPGIGIPVKQGDQVVTEGTVRLWVAHTQFPDAYVLESETSILGDGWFSNGVHTVSWMPNQRDVYVYIEIETPTAILLSNRITYRLYHPKDILFIGHVLTHIGEQIESYREIKDPQLNPVRHPKPPTNYSGTITPKIRHVWVRGGKQSYNLYWEGVPAFQYKLWEASESLRTWKALSLQSAQFLDGLVQVTLTVDHLAEDHRFYHLTFETRTPEPFQVEATTPGPTSAHTIPE